MNEILSVHQLKMEVEHRLLFEDLSFTLQKGEKAALFGRNGVGKTTLFKLLARRLSPTSGTIHWQDVRFGVLDQSVHTKEPVLSYVMAGDVMRAALLAKLEDAESPTYLDDYQLALDKDAFSLEADAVRVLKEIGLSSEHLHQPFDQLSGGEQTRTQLARLYLMRPDVLLLDEPTNHLDGETLVWLTDWILAYPGTVLYVSHERSFIDATADAVLELTSTGVRRFKGNYSAYRQQKDHEESAAKALYAKQERAKNELLQIIGRYDAWHKKATAAASERNPVAKKSAAKHAIKIKAKEQQLKKLEQERVEKPREEAGIRVEFDADTLHAKRLLRLEDVTFGHEGRPLFESVTLEAVRGDRIAIIGPNGSGKTTLLHVMLGTLPPLSGKVERHPSLQIGYFSQSLSTLPQDGTLLDALLDLPISETEARTLLACFLFRRDEVFKPIHEASMGEKCRIAFLRLYFSGARILALDEPTNYLDVMTRERIETALEVFPGELFLISHDTHFTDRLSNKTITLGERIEVHPVGTLELRTGSKADPEATIAELNQLKQALDTPLTFD